MKDEVHLTGGRSHRHCSHEGRTEEEGGIVNQEIMIIGTSTNCVQVALTEAEEQSSLEQEALEFLLEAKQREKEELQAALTVTKRETIS